MGRFLVSDLVEIRIYGWLNLENAMELPLDGNLIGWHAHSKRQALMDAIVTAEYSLFCLSPDEW